MGPAAVCREGDGEAALLRGVSSPSRGEKQTGECHRVGDAFWFGFFFFPDFTPKKAGLPCSPGGGRGSRRGGGGWRGCVTRGVSASQLTCQRWLLSLTAPRSLRQVFLGWFVFFFFFFPKTIL